MSMVSERISRLQHQPARKSFDQLDQTGFISLVGGGTLVATALATRSSVRLPLTVVGMALIGNGLLSRRHDQRASASAKGVRARRGFRFETAISLEVSPEQIYRVWRDFEGLPKILQPSRKRPGRRRWSIPLGRARTTGTDRVGRRNCDRTRKRTAGLAIIARL